ncbi:hypothetical protein WBP07_32620 [Novosphingobium sp. BL-8A]|uniref:hypothetical protein n=1 Tax=Novosphingobium sp. BL-8A TaxID=3127639 RepID=UPI0037582FCD
MRNHLRTSGEKPYARIVFGENDRIPVGNHVNFVSHRFFKMVCYASDMNNTDRHDFQQQFHKLVERNPLAEVESLLYQAIIASDDPLLVSLIKRPVSDFHIDRWPSINAAMKNAGDGLTEGRMGAMILSLVHRNAPDLDMTIEVTFAKSAAEAPFVEQPFSIFNRDDADYAERLNRARSFARLPERPHSIPAQINPKPRLVGMESVTPIYERYYVPGEDWTDRADTVSTTQKLASDLVFLRFCQAAERHVLHSDTARLPTFLSVKMEAWPMETGTVDYCDPAVRIVPA